MSQHDFQLSLWAFALGLAVMAAFSQLVQITPRLAERKPGRLSYGATACVCAIALYGWSQLAFHS